MDVEQIGAISNKDEDAEMGLIHEFWVKWDHLHIARFNSIKQEVKCLVASGAGNLYRRQSCLIQI